MITLKVLKAIKDSSIKDYRQVNDLFEVDVQRLDEMKKSLGNKFELYFLVVKGNKVKKTKK